MYHYLQFKDKSEMFFKLEVKNSKIRMLSRTCQILLILKIYEQRGHSGGKMASNDEVKSKNVNFFLKFFLDSLTQSSKAFKKLKKIVFGIFF